MAGIKTPITDLLTKLRTLSIVNGDGNTATPYVRVWNNQVAYDAEGDLESFPKPAFFVEVVNNPVYDVLGQGFRSSDISFRVHIVHEYYDAQDGTFEQDLPVFALRDMIIANLTGYELTACGPLNCVAETQDYEHKNVYHYICDFVCNFTDSIGSRYDPNHPQAYVDSVPPTELEIDPSLAHGGGQSVTQKFTVNNF